MAIAKVPVVASFSVTLAISQWRLQPIEALALDITRDAAPGIEHLESLRHHVSTGVLAKKATLGA